MDWVWLDPVASRLIAAIIPWGIWDLFKQSLYLLFDGVPDSVDTLEVRILLLALPGVTEVHDLHVWAMDTNQIALTAHLVTNVTDTASLLHEAEEKLQKHFEIRHVTLQQETPAYSHICGLRPGLGC